MKKKTYFCIGLCMIAVALFNWNCTDLELIKSNPLIQNKDFSLQEAKEFFEKQIEQYPMNTRSGKEKSKNQMSPGDFIPKWEDAIASSHTNLACYDIPIEANSHYKAMYSDYKNGKASAHVVNVYQKLVIAKDIKTGELGQYILTLIPDRNYDAKYKKQTCNRFINCADKGEFSGIALYTIPQLNILIRANRYVDGVKKAGVFIPGERKTLKKRLMILNSILKTTVWKQIPAVSTRSFGEDDWDYEQNDDGSDKDYWPIGDDLYYDPNQGVFLWDYDDDGTPDCVWIPEVDITPDDPWDDDPFPPTFDPDPLPEPEPPPYHEEDDIIVTLPIPDKTTPEEPTKVPCTDDINDKSVPMLSMQLAPPDPEKPKGATFGMTRGDGKKMHGGIDLDGDIGDPFYAAHGGTISRIVSEQVNRIEDEYPTGYKGDDNNAGNRIYITVSNGVEDAYFHLQAGEPIAINPRTGELFKVGDEVEMGDIIGYIGITGNANASVPHLHFGVRVNGKWEDPFDYINATLEKDEEGILSISTPCDD